MTDTRDTLGRFQKGNAAAKGHKNTMARRRQALTDTFLRELKQEDFKAIVRKLIDQAKEGDMTAIREVLDRALGRPIPFEPEKGIIDIEVILPPELENI